MSLTGDAIRILAARGFSAEDIAMVADANSGKDDAAERRRAYDRERKKKAKNRNSTGIPPEQSANRSIGIPPEFHRKTPPLARVKDNLLDLGISNTAVVIADTREADWPSDDAHVLAALLVEEAQSPRLDLIKTPGLLTTLARLPAWKASGASWKFDVLPQVTTMARKRGPPIQSWKFFDAAIAQSRDENHAALQSPDASHERHRNYPPRSTPNGQRSRSDTNLAGLALAVNRRRGEDARGAGDDHPGGVAGLKVVSG